MATTIARTATNKGFTISGLQGEFPINSCFIKSGLSIGRPDNILIYQNGVNFNTAGAAPIFNDSYLNILAPTQPTSIGNAITLLDVILNG